MPTNVVRTPRDEHLWEQAKRRAAEEGHARDWPYIMGIYKREHGKGGLKKAGRLVLRRSKGDPLPPGAHWITISREKHPHSPLAGRHILINDSGHVLGGAIPSWMHGRPISELSGGQHEVVGPESPKHPVRRAFTVAHGRMGYDTTDARIQAAIDAFHKHPDAPVAHRLHHLVEHFKAAHGFIPSAAAKLADEVGQQLVRQGHLKPEDVADWQNNAPPAAKPKQPRKPKKPALTYDKPSGEVVREGFDRWAREIGVYPGDPVRAMFDIAHDQRSDYDGPVAGSMWAAGLVSDAEVAAQIRRNIAGLSGLPFQELSLNEIQIIKNFAGDKFEEQLSYAIGLKDGDRVGAAIEQLLESALPALRAGGERGTKAAAAIFVAAHVLPMWTRNYEAMIRAARKLLYQIYEVGSGKSSIWLGVAADCFAEMAQPTFESGGIDSGMASALGQRLQRLWPGVTTPKVLRAIDDPSLAPDAVRPLIERMASFGARKEIVKDALLSAKHQKTTRQVLEGVGAEGEAAEKFWKEALQSRDRSLGITDGARGGPRTLVPVPDAELQRLQKFVDHTSIDRHGFRLKVKQAFAIQYDHPEFDAISQKIDNTREMFHGAKRARIANIVGSGLKMPGGKGVPVATGSMFGRGIYLAGNSTKSGQYVDEYEGALFVVETSLGKELRCGTARPSFSKRSLGDHNSVHGVPGSSLKNDEWVVYDPDQVHLKYVLIVDREKLKRSRPPLRLAVLRRSVTEDMERKYPGGHWVTMHGSHVYIKADGSVAAETQPWRQKSLFGEDAKPGTRRKRPGVVIKPKPPEPEGELPPLLRQPPKPPEPEQPKQPEPKGEKKPKPGPIARDEGWLSPERIGVPALRLMPAAVGIEGNPYVGGKGVAMIGARQVMDLGVKGGWHRYVVHSADGAVMIAHDEKNGRVWVGAAGDGRRRGMMLEGAGTAPLNEADLREIWNAAAYPVWSKRHGTLAEFLEPKRSRKLAGDARQETFGWLEDLREPGKKSEVWRITRGDRQYWVSRSSDDHQKIIVQPAGRGYSGPPMEFIPDDLRHAPGKTPEAQAVQLYRARFEHEEGAYEERLNKKIRATVLAEQEKRGRRYEEGRRLAEELKGYGVREVDFNEEEDNPESRAQIGDLARTAMTAIGSMIPGIGRLPKVRLVLGEFDLKATTAWAYYRAAMHAIFISTKRRGPMQPFFHEYGHALDHALARDSGMPGQQWASANGDLRPLVDAIRETRAYQKVIQWAEQRKDKEYDVRYYSSPEEIFARFFSVYVQRECLERDIRIGSQLREGERFEQFTRTEFEQFARMFEGILAKRGLNKSMLLAAMGLAELRRSAEPVVADGERAVPWHTVYLMLRRDYPATVLGWVRHARWTRSPAVPLSEIDMDRRPGGRNMRKVRDISSKVKDGAAMDPVVLVEVGGAYEVADGYHRLLGLKHAGKTETAAYVAHGAGETGPWQKRMHAEKLNKSRVIFLRARDMFGQQRGSAQRLSFLPKQEPVEFDAPKPKAPPRHDRELSMLGREEREDPERVDLDKKYPGGSWKTIRGHHVYVKRDGEIARETLPIWMRDDAG